jgi:hypothetical protein
MVQWSGRVSAILADSAAWAGFVEFFIVPSVGTVRAEDDGAHCLPAIPVPVPARGATVRAVSGRPTIPSAYIVPESAVRGNVSAGGFSVRRSGFRFIVDSAKAQEEEKACTGCSSCVVC